MIWNFYVIGIIIYSVAGGGHSLRVGGSRGLAGVRQVRVAIHQLRVELPRPIRTRVSF